MRHAAVEEGAGLPRFTFLAAAIAALFAFGFRLLTLTSLTNDHYVYLVWAQQLLLGEVPGRDFVEPGMPLQILLSAAGQAVAPGPASEGILTIGMLALAAAATCAGVAWLTQSVGAGIAAAAFEILIQPRLYSYPKILVPAVLLVLALCYARRPRTPWLLALAAWIAVAFLLRHDLGGYAGIGGLVVVALSHRSFAPCARACVALPLAVIMLLLPYWAFLAWSGGIVEHVAGALEYAKSETHLFEFGWPGFLFGASQPDRTVPWDPDDAAAFLFYCGYALPAMSVLLLLRAEHRRDVMVRSAVAGTVGVAALYGGVILRYPLGARVPDLAALYAILGAWCAVAVIRLSRRPHPASLFSWRTGVRVSLAAAVGMAWLSLDVLADARIRLREARLLAGPAELKGRAGDVMEAGRVWPWPDFWPAGPVPAAIEYVDACTAGDDRMLVTWRAPEFYYFARRGFGSGHAIFLPPRAYTSARDQALMVSRLDRERVPLALINESSRAEFAETYPRVDEYLRLHYMPAGEFTIRDGSVISIAIRRGLTPTGVYGPDAWPCRLVEQAGPTG